MKISVETLGKRFNREWIFKNLTYTFEAGTTYAIVGPNGSGKSTLLQVIAGAILYSEGVMEIKNEEFKTITIDELVIDEDIYNDHKDRLLFIDKDYNLNTSIT